MELRDIVTKRFCALLNFSSKSGIAAAEEFGVNLELSPASASLHDAMFSTGKVLDKQDFTKYQKRVNGYVQLLDNALERLVQCQQEECLVPSFRCSGMNM